MTQCLELLYLQNNFSFYHFGFIVRFDNFSPIWRCHHHRWRAADFNLYSALVAIEQWGFFSLPHPLWHGASVYNGHFRGPVTLTPIAERIAVELSLPVLTNKVCRGWDSNIHSSACGVNALPHCATAAVNHIIRMLTSAHEFCLIEYDRLIVWIRRIGNIPAM